VLAAVLVFAWAAWPSPSADERVKAYQQVIEQQEHVIDSLQSILLSTADSLLILKDLQKIDRSEFDKKLSRLRKQIKANEKIHSLPTRDLDSIVRSLYGPGAICFSKGYTRSDVRPSGGARCAASGDGADGNRTNAADLGHGADSGADRGEPNPANQYSSGRKPGFGNPGRGMGRKIRCSGKAIREKGKREQVAQDRNRGGVRAWIIRGKVTTFAPGRVFCF